MATGTFAGYISVGESKQLYYYFVESLNDPSDDPVVLWLNGGPGCSSLDGFVYEMGPMKFNLRTGDDGLETELTENPYAWNKVINNDCQNQHAYSISRADGPLDFMYIPTLTGHFLSSGG